jgi:short-subunit dehydrogenase
LSRARSRPTSSTAPAWTTPRWAIQSKSDPADVAKDGWDALMAGKDTIISGWMNKLQVAAAGVLPQSVPGEMHRGMAEPGSGSQ